MRIAQKYVDVAERCLVKEDCSGCLFEAVYTCPPEDVLETYREMYVLLKKDREQLEFRQAVAIDFDGTIATAGAWPNVGELIQDAADTIPALSEKYDLVLNTCREGKALEDAILFLQKNNLYGYFNTINCNLPERTNYFGGDCRKISADYYVDDRAIGFSWEKVRETLL